MRELRFYRLRKIVKQKKLGPEAFSGASMTPVTFGLPPLDARTSNVTQSQRKLWLEILKFCEGLVEYAKEAVCIPYAEELPADPEVMRKHGLTPAPPRIITILDNVDSDFYHYLNLYEYESSVDTSHLSSKTPEAHARGSIKGVVPSRGDDVLLLNAFTCHILRFADEHLAPWRELLGEKHKKVIPPDRHWLYAAKARRSKLVSSRLITESENKTAELHKACQDINSRVPSVVYPASALPRDMPLPLVSESARESGQAASAILADDRLAADDRDRQDDAEVKVPEGAAEAAPVYIGPGGKARTTTSTVDGRKWLVWICLIMSIFGDQLTTVRLFLAQLNTDETFAYQGLLASWCDWHGIRVWDLKYIRAVFTMEQAAEAGTITWLTKELKLLRKVRPEKESHYDRLRMHMESMGQLHAVALFRHCLGMHKKVDVPGVCFPPTLQRSTSRLRWFALAIGEYIVKRHILPFGSAEQGVGTKKKALNVCTICQKTFHEVREREAHVSVCLKLYRAGKVVRVAAEATATKVHDFHGDFLWSSLFRYEHKVRTRIGDGHRVCRVLSKYQVCMYQGTHSTSMIREILRMRKQTDVHSGTVSPAMAARVMYDRTLNIYGYCEACDICLERHNCQDKPALSRLREGHTKADAKKAYARGKLKTYIREQRLQSYGVRLASAKKQQSRRRMIVSLGQDLLLDLNVFEDDPSRVYTTILESSTFTIRPVEKANLKSLRRTTASVDKADVLWNTRLRRREEEDLALLQALITEIKHALSLRAPNFS